jgi:hypothetical protein
MDKHGPNGQMWLLRSHEILGRNVSITNDDANVPTHDIPKLPTFRQQAPATTAVIQQFGPDRL